MLVPVLYLAQTRPTNIQPDGALIAGNNVQLISGSNLSNEGTLAAFDNLTLESGGDFTNSGVTQAGQRLVASAQGSIVNRNAGVIRGDDVSLTAVTGDVRNERQLVTREWGTREHGAITTVIGEASTVEASDLSVQAGQDITNLGSRISGDTVQLTAGRDLTVAAVTDQERVAYVYNHGSGSTDTIRQIASEIDADSDLTLTAGRDLAAVAAVIESGGDISLTAGNNVTLLAAANEDHYTFEREEKSGGLFGSKKTEKIERSTVRQQGTTLTAGNDLTIESEQHLVVQSGELHSDDTTTLKAGGVIALKSSKNLDHSVEEKSSKGAIWQSAKGEGKTDETVVHTEITAENLTLEAGQGIQADIKTIDGKNLQQTLQQLSQNPELAWMAQLDNNPDVNWQQVQEIHDSWDYESQGLTGPAAALVAIAVAIATQGIGAGLVSANAGTVTAAAANAGFTSLASQASISLINNQGNIGAVLKELGSSASIKSLTTSVLTAGLTGGAGVPSGAGFAEIAKNIAYQAATKAAVNTAINGGSLGDNFANQLKTGAIAVIGAEVAGDIGLAADSGQINKATQLIAHAALGCAVGEINNGECGGGAIGGVVGEIAADLYLQNWLEKKLTDPNTATQTKAELYQEIQDVKSKGVNLSKLAGGIAALVAKEDVNTAADAAANSAENNALCGGICVGAGLALLYTLYQGEGDPLDGLEAIGAGEDDLSKAIATGVNKAVELSYESYPEQTQATLQLLQRVGEGVDATVTYVDEKTGKTVSSAWHQLDESTQNRLAGGGTLVGVVLSAGSVGKIASLKRLQKKGDVLGGGNQEDIVYRGDRRKPEVIFNEGLQPQDPDANIDLEVYVNSEPSPPSQYVSTTTDKDVAKHFATGYGKQEGYLYDIDKPKHGIDVDKELGNKAFFDESEIAVPGGVYCSAVRGCQPLNPDGTPNGNYLVNPAYKGN